MPAPPRLVPFAELPERAAAAAAALLGMTEAQVRAELAGAPAGFACVALLEDDERVAAAGLRIPPGGIAPGRADLAWLCAEATAPALQLVGRFVAGARDAGAEVVQVVARRAPGLDEALAAAGWERTPGMLRLRCVAPRPPGALPAGVTELSLAEAGGEALRQVWNAAFEGVDFSAPMTAAELAALLADPGFDAGLARVLVDAEGPVAFLQGTLRPGGGGEVHAIGVVPRGRRLGLGRWVLRRCAGLLAEAGAREVVLRVAESNAPARALYAAEGWMEVHRAPAWRRPASATPPVPP